MAAATPHSSICSAPLTPRSLDLTGPLLLGGVPNLPENFPVSHKDFVGCMRDLHIDGRRVDMASFVANNGTVAGRPRPHHREKMEGFMDGLKL